MKIYFENGHYCEPIGDVNKKIDKGGSILGEGAEGIVYKVKYSADGGVYAFKLYKNIGANAQRYAPSSPFIANLKRNIADGKPSASFVWPIAITKPFSNNKMGYLMEMYGSDFVSYDKILQSRIMFSGMRAKIRAMIEIAVAFKALHATGKSLQDFNDGGVVFNIKTGEIKICDCDNVAPYGLGFGILGKGSYMAPEIKAKIGIVPDKYSDYLSMAIVFFELLTHGEPYTGKLTLDDNVKIPGYENDDGPIPENVLYGDLATFIFDPDDDTNRPMVKQQNTVKYWSCIPGAIQKLFLATFTKGMPKKFKKGSNIDVDALKVDRQQRTTCEGWLRILRKWFDCLYCCPRCNAGNIINIISKPEGAALGNAQCFSCGDPFPMDIPIVEFKRNGTVIHTVPLTDGQEFLSLHTDPNGDFKVISQGMLSKNYDPNKNGGRRVFFLKNMTGNAVNYFATHPDGKTETAVCQYGGFIACKNGIEVSLNANCVAKIYSPFNISERLIKN